VFVGWVKRFAHHLKQTFKVSGQGVPSKGHNPNVPSMYHETDRPTVQTFMSGEGA